MKRRTLLSTLLALAVVFSSPACVGPKAPAPAVSRTPAISFPGAEWEKVADPRKVGWSGEGLAAVLERVKTMPTTGLMIVVGGRVLLEYGDVVELSYLASVRKSVLAMLYSNWDFNALGTIFEQETGRNIYDALETDLAVPIGMQDFKREAQWKSGDLTKSIHPAYHIWLSTRDMARLGYLMLREGNWDGKQLVPRDWVRKITSPVTRLQDMNPDYMRQGRLGYGYLWWVFDGPWGQGAYEGAYSGAGAGGQFITVLPKLDLVVAHKTNRARTNDKSVQVRDYLVFLDKIVAARVAKSSPVLSGFPCSASPGC
jgi:CubicO group peptidase (beta-lactamase class C family)